MLKMERGDEGEVVWWVVVVCTYLLPLLLLLVFSTHSPPLSTHS